MLQNTTKETSSYVSFAVVFLRDQMMVPLAAEERLTGY
jgi:hypothetical protein